MTGNGGKVDELKALGHTTNIEKEKDLTIEKYNKDITTKYIN